MLSFNIQQRVTILIISLICNIIRRGILTVNVYFHVFCVINTFLDSEK